MARSANPSNVEVIEMVELEGRLSDRSGGSSNIGSASSSKRFPHIALLTSYTTRAGLSGCCDHPSNSTSCFDSEARNHTALDIKKARLEVPRLDEGAEPTPKV
nr:hypothetical protein L204_01784 [Cryptococcus depauperatus CBS 7855]